VREWVHAAACEAGVIDGNKTIDDLSDYWREKRNYPKLHVAVSMSKEKAPERYKNMLIQAKMHNLQIHSIPWIDKTLYPSKGYVTRQILRNLLEKTKDIPDDEYILIAQDDTVFHRDFRSELMKTIDSLPTDCR